MNWVVYFSGALIGFVVGLIIVVCFWWFIPIGETLAVNIPICMFFVGFLVAYFIRSANSG